MHILFNDVIQKSNAPNELKSPALSETFTLNGNTGSMLGNNKSINVELQTQEIVNSERLNLNSNRELSLESPREILQKINSIALSEILITLDKPRDINSIGLGNCENNIKVELIGQEIVTKEITEEIILKEAGEDWEFVNNFTNIYVWNIVYGNGVYVLTSYEWVYTSTDLIKFTERRIGNSSWNNAKYLNGKFILMNTRFEFTTSADGINWTTPQRTIPNSIRDVFDFTFAFGKYFAIGTDNTTTPWTGQILTSMDCINWNIIQRPTAGTNEWHNILLANNKLFLFGNGNSIDNSFVSSTSDGVNWTRQMIGGAYTSGFKYAYGAGKFVEISYNGFVRTSIDGSTWTTAQQIQGLNRVKYLLFAAGKFIVYGEWHGIFTSNDGINWSFIFNDTNFNNSFNSRLSLNNLIYANNMLIGFDNYFIGRAVISKGETNILTYTVDTIEQKLKYENNISSTDNGLYLLDKKYNDVEFIKLTTNGKIGRFAAGMARNIPTSIAKELTFCSTAEPRLTLSGQVIQGLGGYNYKTLSLDSRYKINEEIMNDILEAYPFIALGYPFFIDLSAENYKLPIKRLYAVDKNQQNFGFESGVKKYLHSRRFVFQECF